MSGDRSICDALLMETRASLLMEKSEEIMDFYVRRALSVNCKAK